VDDFDAIADGDDADNERNAWTACYERPAVLAMVGDVRGLRVLDAGCGGGLHAAALIERGAAVTGIDASAAMLRIARRRLHGRAELVQADLRRPLPLDDGTFDIVLASLVLHHLRDWGPPLGEFHRVLRPHGRLVFSTHHPFMDQTLGSGENSFDTYPLTERWRRGDDVATMRFWHRPLHAMFDALHSAGFRVVQLREPQPHDRTRFEHPREYELLRTRPRFLFFDAVREADAAPIGAGAARDVTVRPARSEDAVRMADILNTVIELGGRTSHTTRFDAARIEAEFIAAPRGVSCFVALVDGGIAGFQAVEWSDPAWRGEDPLPEDWAFISTYVAPEHHRRGLARAMFERSVRAARAAGVRCIDATIREGNDEALAYYGSVGFTEYRRRPGAVSTRFVLRA